MAIALVFAAALVPARAADWHVRSLEREYAQLIRHGYERSVTFRQLVDNLNASDVLVYVHPQVTLRGTGGYLLNTVASAGGRRYLHVKLRAGGGDGTIAILAHELQHAYEVAQALDVHDAERMIALFARLDNGTCLRGNCFETDAAQDLQRDVAAELATWRKAKAKAKAKGRAGV
jgi:hypothetical protein